MPPGLYEGFGTTLEMLEDGSLHVAGTEYLAGSTTSLDGAISVAMRDGGLAIDEAVRLVTSNPASLLASWLEGDRGQIRIGASADLVVLRLDPQSMDVTVERTVVAGREVFNGGQAQGQGVP
jgi:N-acetylglucosamine-6-phosphate deacetylase